MRGCWFSFLVAVCLMAAQWASAAGPAKLVVKNARLMTMADGQKEPFTGYLVVDNEGKLTAVGTGEPPAGLAAQSTWDAHGEWIIPGFLSAHSHLWQSAFRGIAADKTLPGWIDGLYGQHASHAQAEDYYWFTLHGALDHLEHGITGAYDFAYGGTRGGLCKGIDCDEASFRGESDSGIRFVHGYQPDQIGPGDGLPEARTRLKAFLDWTAQQPKSSKFLSVMLNGSTSFNETYQQAVVEKALMDEFHVGNQSHYLEPPDTVGIEQSKFRWFMDSGLLGRHSTSVTLSTPMILFSTRWPQRTEA